MIIWSTLWGSISTARTFGLVYVKAQSARKILTSGLGNSVEKGLIIIQIGHKENHQQLDQQDIVQKDMDGITTFRGTQVILMQMQDKNSFVKWKGD